VSVTIIEERVAFLEGRLIEQSATFERLRVSVSKLAGRVDQLELTMNGRFDRVSDQMATHFRWLVGIQLTTATTMIAALIGALFVR
jgi:hypothetical protein